MILLTILKIIGICILLILAILLLILFVLLFVPVRYRSTGKLSKDDRHVTAKVSWLASAVAVIVKYGDEKLVWAVRIFGIQLLPKKKKVGRKPEKKTKKTSGKTIRKKDGKKNKNSSWEKDQAADETVKEEKKRRPHQNREQEETEKHEYSREKSPEEERERSEPATDSETETSEQQELSFFERLFQKISNFFAGIRERFTKIRESVSQIRDKIRNVQTRLEETKKKAQRWKKLLGMEETKVTLGVLKAEFARLIRYLLPTRIRARIRFGFEDPADTGVTLGAISAVYGFFPKGIDLEPDFEEKVLEGEWKLRGRIRLVYFVRLAVRLVRKKENRITLRRVRKLL